MIAEKSLRRWAGPLAIAAAAEAMLLWTWGTWPDPVVDFGRELYVPWQLVAGKTLYRDIAYHNGPLSPYWNSLWFRMLGVSLRTLVVANCAVLAMLLGLVWHAASELGSRVSATVACLAVVGIFAFGQYVGIGNYNWMSPYSHEVTHGVLLSVAALHFLHVYERRGALRFVVLSGLCVGLCFLTKVEVALACLAGAGSGLAVLLWTGRRWAALPAWMASCLAPIAVATAALSLRMPADEAVKGALGAFRYVSGVGHAGERFLLANAGLLDPGENLRRVLLGLAAYAALAAAGGLCVRLRIKPALACGVLAALLGLLWTRLDWSAFAAPWPLFLAGLAIWTLASDRSSFRLSWIVLALALLAKIPLAVRVWHYGFGLALPAAVVIVVATVDWLPAWLGRATRGELARALAVTAWAGAIVVHLALTARFVDRKDVVVGEGPDAFRADVRGVFVNGALEEIAKHPGTLTSLPDAEMLNYLARRANPLRYGNFNPHQVATFGEDNMIRSFEEHPPELIALVQADMSEYGVRFFGHDYATRLAEWIRTHYETAALVGVEPFKDNGGYGIEVLVRRKTEGAR